MTKATGTTKDTCTTKDTIYTKQHPLGELCPCCEVIPCSDCSVIYTKTNPLAYDTCDACINAFPNTGETLYLLD